MKRIISSLTLLLMLLAINAPAAQARRRVEAGEKPIITLQSSIYETVGSGRTFNLVIGGRAGAYIDVDCGDGPVEVELVPATVQNGYVVAANATCQVNASGIVNIYGNPADIDYFEAEGCYLRRCDISALTELTGLNLQHNELQSLDLTANTKLQTITLGDNPFSKESPLKIGAPKPDLVLLEMGTMDWLDQSFNLSDYPALVSFDAFGCQDLQRLDPTGCPELVRLTADVTPITSIDVSKNTKLRILNVADTRITSLDVSKNTALQQLFCNHDSYLYQGYKLKELDVTNNPDLIYLFCAGNDITQLDLSKNTKLVEISLARNRLTSIDLTNCISLVNVNISNNDMGFSTMPVNTGWNEYYYEQRPSKVRRSFKVGDTIDLTAKMNREGTITTATLMKKNEADFSNPIPVDPSLYTVDTDGRVTLKTAIADSVFVSYINDRFDEATLATTHFVVKTPGDYRTEHTALTFKPAAGVSTVSFAFGAIGTAEDGESLPRFDLGDGVATAIGVYNAADSLYHVDATLTGTGPVNIILPEGMDGTAFAINGVALESLDLTGSPLLKKLTVKNAGLTAINLERHRCLEVIHLEGNNLANFSIKALNMNFNKTMLYDLKVPNNNIVNFTFDGLEGIRYLDLSGNKLTEIDLITANKAKTINLSGNQLTELSMLKLDAIIDINISNNKISSIMMPEITVPTSMNISGNRMSLANLPSPSLFAGSYKYAPQQPVTIPSKGPGIDLSSQYRVEAGYPTEFVLTKTDGTPVVAGIDYSITAGVIRFTNSGLGTVKCTIKHPGFPQFTGANALVTTEMLVTERPDNVIASFTTTQSGQTVRVSLAATVDKTSVFFDWKGDGSSLSMYDLTTTYTEFYATTTAGANVKVYTYDDSAPLSVFSIMGASMSDCDLSKLTSAITINVSNAGLSDIKLPAPGALQELFLSGNKLTNSFDLSAYKEIYYLSLTNNLFEGEMDLSVLPNLQLMSIAGNKLTGVKFDNPKLWALDLNRNLIESIAFTGASNLEEIGLSGNKLTSLNVSRLRYLKSLFIDNNRFRFSTLPATRYPKVLYVYGNQAPVDVTPNGMNVDLATEAMVGATPTTYRWFIDEVSVDENGELQGEELILDEEYTIANGVTSFKVPMQRVIGVMTNAEFPKLFLYTRMVDISGADSTLADATLKAWSEGGNIHVSSSVATTVTIYDITGRLVGTHAIEAGNNNLGSFATGAYIITAPGHACKIAVR